MRFSPQQETFLRWLLDPRTVSPAKRNALLIAVAGAGKSTALVEGARRLVEAANGRRLSIALSVYNKAAQMDLDGKLKAIGLGFKSGVIAGTFHSFGMSALRRWSPDLSNDKAVDPKKLVRLAEELKVPEHVAEFAIAAASLAKQRAFGVLTPLEDRAAWYRMAEHYELTDLLGDLTLSNEINETRLEQGVTSAIALVRESVRVARELIDYDDMIYVPLAANIKVWQNDWVFVDEAQDTNPARRALAKRMLLPNGRFVAVGDPFQAIYGFTGADNDSLDILQREFDAVELPLTTTFRCPKAVVRYAHDIAGVTHIQAADIAPEGSTEVMTVAEFDKLGKAELTADTAILCRNTAPLVSLAFGFLRRKIPCHIEGRDIGAGLIALATKWKSARTVASLRGRLEVYLQKETAKLMAKGQELLAANLNDRVESLYVIMAEMPEDAPVSVVADHVRSLFETTPDGKPAATLTLATAHRSKGREWPTVYLYRRADLMPSPYARQTWQQDQERNLIYVAITRAKARLVDVIASTSTAR